MSDIRKSISKLVAAKTSAAESRVAEAADTDAAIGVLDNYNLYFTGAKDALTAAGVDATDATAIDLAQASIASQITALENKQALAAELAE